jgi:hypothetical protein
VGWWKIVNEYENLASHASHTVRDLHPEILATAANMRIITEDLIFFLNCSKYCSVACFVAVSIYFALRSVVVTTFLLKIDILMELFCRQFRFGPDGSIIFSVRGYDIELKGPKTCVNY